MARQLKNVAREGRRENLVLRNEAKPSGGSPVRQLTQNLKPESEFVSVVGPSGCEGTRLIQGDQRFWLVELRPG